MQAVLVTSRLLREASGCEAHARLHEDRTRCKQVILCGHGLLSFDKSVAETVFPPHPQLHDPEFHILLHRIDSSRRKALEHPVAIFGSPAQGSAIIEWLSERTETLI